MAELGTLMVSVDTTEAMERLREVKKRFAELDAAKLAHEFAIKFGLRTGMTFTEAGVLERDLATFLAAHQARIESLGR